MSFSLSPYALSLDPSDFCQPPPHIEKIISQANPENIESILDQYPDNFWIQRAYIGFQTASPDPPAQSAVIPQGKVAASVIERFKVKYESHPEDPQAAYLFAYALIHTDTAKSVKILTDITGKAPPFPPGFMTLAILHRYPAFRDPGKQSSYTESFLACCPRTVGRTIANLALQLNKSDALSLFIRSLRERIAGKDDETLLPFYTDLWQLEMKNALPEEIKECEDRIRKDLAFLKGLDPNEFKQAPTLIIQGYSQIGDTAALEEFNKSGDKFNSSIAPTLFSRARTEWYRENPLPPFAATNEEFANYYEKQLQFLNHWLEGMPGNMMILEPRFQALAFIPYTSNEILISEGNQILELARRAQNGTYASAAIRVVKAWADRDISLDRIPSIAREIISLQSGKQSITGTDIQSDLTGGDDSLMKESQRWAANSVAWSVLASVLSKSGEFDQVKDILIEWTQALDERRKRADAIQAKQMEQIQAARASNPSRIPQNLFNALETSIVQGIRRDESRYYEACAKLAQAEGRTVDALTFYQSSLRMLFRGPFSPVDLRDIECMKTAGGILWKQIGRTQEEWDEWFQSVQPRVQSIPRQAMKTRQVPEFSLPDQHGKIWTLANLKGKKTLINVWATWCGPCRRELPHLEKLYAKTTDRDDIQVITLNIDQDKSLAEQFLKENKFTFPALYADAFVKEFAGSIGIPITWITDPGAIICSETLGFTGNGQWVDQTLKELENINTRVEGAQP